MTRQQANKEILRILSVMVEIFPDMRFGQLLANADVLKYDPHSSGIKTIRDEYHLESKDLLERVKNSPLLEVQYVRGKQSSES